MEKFYWDPRDQELVETIYQMYKDDHLTKEDIVALKDTFPKQRTYLFTALSTLQRHIAALDFFGAMRAATYDHQIRDWISATLGKLARLN